MAGSSAPPPKRYLFTQSTAAATWQIHHNLGVYPQVLVMDSASNEVEGDVHYVDLNNVVLSFAFAFAGTASLS